MIDFTLSAKEQETRQNASAFAKGVLKGASETYLKIENDGVSRFLATKPFFETATSLGIIKSLVPPHLGGVGGSLVDAALITEELFAVEPGVALNILTVSLGLMPLLFSPAPVELQKEIVGPFLTGKGAPLAAFLWSEPTGTANYMEKGANGIQTLAKKEGSEWVISGEKIWAGNCAGWDGKGADVQTLYCRNAEVNTNDPSDSALLFVITREVLEKNQPEGFKVVQYKDTPGFSVHCGPHVAFKQLHVPERYLIATGRAAEQITQTTFAATGAMVGAMGVGIMRTAFDCALKFAREEDQGGSVKVLERQSAADLLIALKIKINTARLLSWKAAHAMDNQINGAVEQCSEAKIYGSEACVQGVAEAMRVIGISSWAADYPFAQLVRDAALLPIFDGGNQGVRRRLIQNRMLQSEYNPWECVFASKQE